MRGVRVGSVILLPVAACSCGEFRTHKIITSNSGVHATIAVPPSGDAWTLCLSEQTITKCSRASALVYVYRGEKFDIWWERDDLLIVKQIGGEVRKGPPRTPVVLRGRSITIKLDYSPS